MKGVVFQPFGRSRSAANIIFKCQHSGDVPAQIVAVFLHNSVNNTQIRPQVVLVVRRHVKFRQSDVQYDYYRQFDFFVAGGLFYERFDDLEVINPTQILHHFAKTPYHPINNEEISEAAVHVLPCNKVGWPSSLRIRVSSPNSSQEFHFDIEESQEDDAETHNNGAGEDADGWMDVPMDATL